MKEERPDVAADPGEKRARKRPRSGRMQRKRFFKIRGWTICP